MTRKGIMVIGLKFMSGRWGLLRSNPSPPLVVGFRGGHEIGCYAFVFTSNFGFGLCLREPFWFWALDLGRPSIFGTRWDLYLNTVKFRYMNVTSFK